jgi:hypothetical protein
MMNVTANVSTSRHGDVDPLFRLVFVQEQIGHLCGVQKVVPIGKKTEAGLNIFARKLWESIQNIRDIIARR